MGDELLPSRIPKDWEVVSNELEEQPFSDLRVWVVKLKKGDKTVEGRDTTAQGALDNAIIAAETWGNK